MAGDSEYELEPIREGADFTLYRGRERGNQMPILAVAVAAEEPSPQSLRRLEHEYSLAREFDAAWAALPLALTRHQGRAVLILKDPGGEPLDRVIEQHKRQLIDLTRFLRISIGLAAALGQVHRQGLIHKDVKPDNALVEDSGHVWLTGFGLASKLRHERQVPVPPEIIAGTLAYMAPEQTGRMNRSIDSRSDLYSLGVTLYQTLTGVLPFAAADPLEWIHCHIARQPAAPIDRREVPEPLSAIIMRLLAKNAEERYQTAAGLEADLRRCLVEWQSQGRIDPFTLGADDTSDRLLIPEKLYGREREVDALIAAFDRVVAQGTAELVLVSGYSGVGKSSVVNELHKVLVPPRGLFAAGKFDQYKRDVPYATLAQAFQMLVREILVKSEAEVDRWRHALLEALGPNGQLMVNLIPELEFLIGKQPPVAELPPQEARGRFQLVFRRFLGAFARPEHPLALFLDDLQWLDRATLELLERLMTDPDVQHVLLIGAYRDNEVSSSHALMQTLTAIRDAGAKTQEIVLAPLRLDDVERLIAEALRCGRNSADPLALLVHEKTGGNPFFAIQFLNALAEEGLLRFDRDAPGWIWDLGRIRATGYSDNVVDLMLGKLRRLSGRTQSALQQLACLGNVAGIATLGVVFGQSEEQIHTALLEAVHNGLILRLEGSYAFLHDRIQEAAYALIPESARAEVHLRIGRELLASLTSDGLADFDVANQFNRSATLLIEHDEKVRVAAIDLRAGRKAKASAAYASALAYFVAGMALLDEREWGSHYGLTFSLGLERVECELLCGNTERAGQLIAELLPRAATRVDEAAVYNLKVQLHVMKAEHQQAVATALTCLRRFGIDMPAQPTEEQAQAEYETLWQVLDARPIESLIDLPLMTDPELRAAMQMLSALIPPAYFTDQRLFRLQVCRMVTISLQRGPSMDSATGYAYFGIILVTAFHRYSDGYRFAKLACDLLDKYGFIANRGTVCTTIAMVAAWTQPIGTAIDFSRTGIPAAIETGNLTHACYGLLFSLTYLLLRGDPLDLVWRESEVALDFARKVRYSDVADIIVSQQRFIATMQGRTRAFSTFSDAQFDEATFEAQLTGDRTPMLIYSYQILKLEARFLSGDFAEALAAAAKAKSLLGASAGQIQQLDYFYYAALTVSALYEAASADQQQAWRKLLMEHREQLRGWAENYPPTFADKHTLVLAEIARLEKRDTDAPQLYEQAIHMARENGFVQNEGLAHELAAQYYLARGIETAGYAYLRNARNCYDRWGAIGKVKQLDERYPRLREEGTSTSSATIGPPVEQLDVETVVKASQALSSEMALPKLIERLVRIAVEHAGAERGLLILIRGSEPRIEAEATTGQGRVEVTARRAAITPSDLPESALQYVIRTQEVVLLDDASADKVYSKDEYVRQKRSKSVLCLPIVKQTQLVGALYLENNLTPGAFTPDRVALLQWLASQAAISLENAALYSDLQRSEAFLAQGQSISHTGSSGWSVASDEIYWSQEIYNILEYDPGTIGTIDLVFQRIHPDDRDFVRQALDQASKTKTDFEIEHRLLMPDGRVKHVHIIGQAVNAGSLDFLSSVHDVSERTRAEEALRQAQDDLARINRVTTMGELAASLAHEISQPISGIMTNANTCLRKLGPNQPDPDEMRALVSRILRDTQRAAEVIGRIRSQFKKGATPNREVIDINEINRETVALLRDEAVRYNISVRTELAADPPQTLGDRVQLQQVAMNLIINSIEAMKDVDGIREMVIKSQRDENEQIHVSFSDTGIGFPPQLAEQIFDPFFTTKPQGTGMGLRISRSIIESHGGRLWAVGAPGRGATFHLSLPAATRGHR
jgi:PAS domain S-box-containing protein